MIGVKCYTVIRFKNKVILKMKEVVMNLNASDFYLMFWGGTSPENKEQERALAEATRLYNDEDYTSREACNIASQMYNDGKFKVPDERG